MGTPEAARGKPHPRQPACPAPLGTLALGAGIALGSVVAWQAARLHAAARRGHALAQLARPFEHRPAQPVARVLLLADEARRGGVQFIDFFRPPGEDLFARRAGIYFAGDGVHPSAHSYRHCFEVLRRQTPLPALLTPP